MMCPRRGKAGPLGIVLGGLFRGRRVARCPNRLPNRPRTKVDLALIDEGATIRVGKSEVHRDHPAGRSLVLPR